MGEWFAVIQWFARTRVKQMHIPVVYLVPEICCTYTVRYVLNELIMGTVLRDCQRVGKIYVEILA